MTQTAWRTLWVLRLAGTRYNQSELALRLGIETPTLVKILDRMEAKSLLRRVPDTNDRRQKHVEITEVGLRLAEEIEGHVLDVRRTLMADATPAELEVGIRLLERIVGRTSKV
jgi:MarR family transcriptional regulator for hemolysin